MLQAAAAPPNPEAGMDVSAAIELNTADWLRLKGVLPWVELHDEPDVTWIFAGDTWPANSATLANFPDATAHHRIAEILERHLEQRTACNWIVGAASRPLDIGKHLKANGFSCRIHCAGMACDLHRLGARLLAPAGVRVELLEAPVSLVHGTTERRRRRAEGRRLMAGHKPRVVWHFLASVDGRPVGETTMLEGSGVAGIYDVEVLEKFRRRGIGSALVDAALRHGRKLGYPTAVLGATGMGSKMYARVGFRELSKLSFWKYGKMRQQ
jgi:GNAT superfamily N-acetyltransferase